MERLSGFMLSPARRITYQGNNGPSVAYSYNEQVSKLVFSVRGNTNPDARRGLWDTNQLVRWHF